MGAFEVIVCLVLFVVLVVVVHDLVARRISVSSSDLKREIASLEKSLQFHVDDHNSVIEHNHKLSRRFNSFRRETEQRIEQIRVLLREIVDLSTEEDFNDDEDSPF